MPLPYAFLISLALLLLHHRPQHPNLFAPLIRLRRMTLYKCVFDWLIDWLIDWITRLTSWFGMALSSAGLSPIYHVAPFVLNVITKTALSCILPLLVFPRALFSALYSSSCTLPLFPWSWPPSLCRWHCALLFPPSQLWLAGWLLIFLLLIFLRLNSWSSDSKTNLPKMSK